MSGHSKWATIKHKKGALDAKRGKLFTKLIKELTVAARMGGGDPAGNPRLRKAIADAKGQSMPNDTIHRAVKRGTGELEGVTYEEIVYEGTGPGGTLFLVERMTDNRNRTVAEIRKIFEKNNGVLGGAGTAGWAFERKGIVAVGKERHARTSSWRSPSARAPRTTRTAAKSGSSRRPPDALETRRSRRSRRRASSPSRARLAYVPKTKKPLAGRDAQVALNLAEALDDHDDVQNVYADFDISDEELASLRRGLTARQAKPDDAIGPRARSGHPPLRLGRRPARRGRASCTSAHGIVHTDERTSIADAARRHRAGARRGRRRPRARRGERRGASSSRRTRRPRPSSGTREGWRFSCARAPGSRSTSTHRPG